MLAKSSATAIFYEWTQKGIHKGILKDIHFISVLYQR